MNPQVVAAVIAAGVSGLTLVGTLAAQSLGRRATRRDTEKTLEKQREHLDLTLAEQGRHLDRTLAEQGRQLDRTLAEQRIRTLNERFAMAAGQLGNDKSAAVRLAGVYAMAALADDWGFSKANQQACVDVLCGYLRMPYERLIGEKDSVPEQLAFRASREVRGTVIRVITAHLREDAAVSWQGLNFDFTGAVFDRSSFHGAEFSGGTVSFAYARFSGGTVNFYEAEFSGAVVHFTGAKFTGGGPEFLFAKFTGGTVDFVDADFAGGTVNFGGAKFSGGTVSFNLTKFSGGIVNFSLAEFSGGTVHFARAWFSGSRVLFADAKFTGGTVDFTDPMDWSCPPEFPWKGAPPSGVQLHSSGAARLMAKAP
jgi:uncharacterized protein YjbI with pentapeptide repeats